MKKTLVAVAALVATGAFADVALTGNIEQDYFSKTVAGVRTSGLGSNYSGSYLTFSGNEDLGSGLKASFKLEQGLGVNNVSSGTLAGAASDSSSVGNREAWLNLSGAFGGIYLGQQYSNAFGVLAATDPNGLNNLAVGYSASGSIPVVQAANTISYVLPSVVSGLNLTFQKRNQRDTNGTASATGTVAASTSFAATYSSGPLYIGVATDSVNGLNTTTTGATYDLGVAKLHLSNVNQATSATATTTDTMYAVSAPVTDALKVAYSSSTNKVGSAASTTSSQIGAYYSLSKRTTAFIINGSKASANTNVTAVGINHAF